MKSADNNNNGRRPGRGRGRGQQRSRDQQQQQPTNRRSGRHPSNNRSTSPKPTSTTGKERKILVLHGSRQTGQLLLGRIDKLKRALQKECSNLQLVVPDAPYDHPDEPNLRQWWERKDNSYEGLETSIQLLKDLWVNEEEDGGGGTIGGIIGFSQGARLAHLIAFLHQTAKSQNLTNIPFSGLKFVILVAAYDAPIPDNWTSTLEACALDYDATLRDDMIDLPSLHIWGSSDSLVLPEQSQTVMAKYVNPMSHEHEGGHHVPMKAQSIRAYIDFVKQQQSSCESTSSVVGNSSKIPGQGQDARAQAPPATTSSKTSSPPIVTQPKKQEEMIIPDEETALAQHDEVEALTAIYPDEVAMISKVTTNNQTGESSYQHPISFRIALHPEDDIEPVGGHWPKHPLALTVTYPHNYPGDDALPQFQLVHENNVMEFPSATAAACMARIQEAAEAERGMPCVLSCLYAAKEFLDSGQEVEALQSGTKQDGATSNEPDGAPSENDEAPSNTVGANLLKLASAERIHQCNMEGLEIAEALLGRASCTPTSDNNSSDSVSGTPVLSGKGGSWVYTVGLVGKPSAGKSTFFNTASGFARQRDDADNVLGGAAVAAHPFTTIDPNVGVCLVPAPAGSCPEEDIDDATRTSMNIGSSHGRDALGRRLLPVLLKDVAGLVPGAYNGRGRGNKFLNDLTDADVLVHVVDASGTADAEGNVIGEAEVGAESKTKLTQSQPLEDLAWIRNELIEWVFTNLMYKWDTVIRRGRSKLSGMFSGYGQASGVTSDVLNAVEKHMERTEQRDRALDHLHEWDTGDVHRLVSAFLGVRFPMALALNKCDMPSSAKHVKAIQEALPLHGAHIGVPLSARSEMNFVRHHILQHSSLKLVDDDGQKASKKGGDEKPPLGTWQCLQSAMTLREPVLVFPVSDMTTYQPLPGLAKQATGDPSLPTAGMIACLQAAGGAAPSMWDPIQKIYTPTATTTSSKNTKQQSFVLRDVLVMKPGSTVEDVFFALKRLGALGGDFVRAEAAGKIQEMSKQIKKDTLVGKNFRILKIMTTKRSPWQQQHAQQKQQQAGKNK